MKWKWVIAGTHCSDLFLHRKRHLWMHSASQMLCQCHSQWELFGTGLWGNPSLLLRLKLIRKATSLNLSYDTSGNAVSWKLIARHSRLPFAGMNWDAILFEGSVRKNRDHNMSCIAQQQFFPFRWSTRICFIVELCYCGHSTLEVALPRFAVRYKQTWVTEQSDKVST